jgi:hypothetical protein
MVLTSDLPLWTTFCFFSGVIIFTFPRAPALLLFGVTFLVDAV